MVSVPKQNCCAPNMGQQQSYQGMSSERAWMSGACMQSSRLYSTVCRALAANMSKSSNTNTAILWPLPHPLPVKSGSDNMDKAAQGIAE